MTLKKLSPLLGEQPNGCILFMCPACDHVHSLPIEGRYTGPHDKWTWNGNVDKPTFAPSVRAWYDRPAHDGRPARTYVCHSFVREGRIEYLSDCTHRLAGQTVDLIPLPEEYYGGFSQ
jgi:uncharacterized protein YlaI